MCPPPGFRRVGVRVWRLGRCLCFGFEDGLGGSSVVLGGCHRGCWRCGAYGAGASVGPGCFAGVVEGVGPVSCLLGSVVMPTQRGQIDRRRCPARVVWFCVVEVAGHCGSGAAVHAARPVPQGDEVSLLLGRSVGAGHRLHQGPVTRVDQRSRDGDVQVGEQGGDDVGGDVAGLDGHAAGERASHRSCTVDLAGLVERVAWISQVGEHPVRDPVRHHTRTLVVLIGLNRVERP